jgi:hypothetical protein
MKNELNTCFQQKFAMGSYGVGIGRAWCSRKACEICSSLVQKKKKIKKKISSHKLPKQQSTNFWSQGILGVNEGININIFFKIFKNCASLINRLSWSWFNNIIQKKFLFYFLNKKNKKNNNSKIKI